MRIDPAHAGLPGGPRRRTPGLRREEVAVLAGVSPTWYTYLEQARNVRPSAEVLDSLARVLRFTEDERRYMYLLVRGPNEPLEPTGSDHDSDEFVRALVRSCTDPDTPVYGVDVRTDIIACNAAATEWYGGFRGSTGTDNFLRWLFTSPEARRVLPDWEAEARNVVARWRSMIARLGNDKLVQDLVTEFDADPYFHDLWHQLDVEEHRTRVRRLCHPVRGVQRFQLIVVTSTDFDGSIAVFHLPRPAGEVPDQRPTRAERG